MLLTMTISAGQTVQFSEASDFFRLMNATNAVDVRFYRAGSMVVESPGVNAGYSEKFASDANGVGFDSFQISSATTQQIQFVARLGNEVSYDGSVMLTGGSVTVANVNGAFASAQKTVANTSGQVLAVNASRRYLSIQNNDAAGIVYVNLQGSTATTANSIKIQPGGSLTIEGFAPNGAITAIGSIASNANVVAVEG